MVEFPAYSFPATVICGWSCCTLSVLRSQKLFFYLCTGFGGLKGSVFFCLKFESFWRNDVYLPPTFRSVRRSENDRGWKRINKLNKRQERYGGLWGKSGNLGEKLSKEQNVGGRHGCEQKCRIADCKVNKQALFHSGGEIPLQHVHTQTQIHTTVLVNFIPAVHPNAFP